MKNYKMVKIVHIKKLIFCKINCNKLKWPIKIFKTNIIISVRILMKYYKKRLLYKKNMKSFYNNNVSKTIIKRSQKLKKMKSIINKS